MFCRFLISQNRFDIRLGKLEKIGKKVEDVEEGQIPNTTSVEEILKEDSIGKMLRHKTVVERSLATE
ncbi:hypothetical protein VNO78_01691 [Psophocarpus tetragonolobus]|uniref:Uncharacterized protein n=1 Tax=Psophocarpus tetragonolobus TaxID=3891 RepID=A0AAN9SZB2_PSOTE